MERTTHDFERLRLNLVRRTNTCLSLAIKMAESLEEEENAWRQLSALEELATEYRVVVGLDDWGDDGTALDRETYSIRVLAKTSELLCALKLSDDRTDALRLLGAFALRMEEIQERLFLCLTWEEEDRQSLRFN